METYFGGIGNDVLHITRSVDLGLGVRALGCEVRESGHLQGEGLAIDDVPVEGVELDPGHCIECALEVRDGEEVARGVQHETAEWLRKLSASIFHIVRNKTETKKETNIKDIIYKEEKL